MPQYSLCPHCITVAPFFSFSSLVGYLLHPLFAEVRIKYHTLRKGIFFREGRNYVLAFYKSYNIFFSTFFMSFHKKVKYPFDAIFILSNCACINTSFRKMKVIFLQIFHSSSSKLSSTYVPILCLLKKNFHDRLSHRVRIP